MTEYRDDDPTDGYCPSGGARLTGLTTTGRGYCEKHAWRYANWSRAGVEQWAHDHDEYEYLRMEQKMDEAGLL